MALDLVQNMLARCCVLYVALTAGHNDTVTKMEYTQYIHKTFSTINLNLTTIQLDIIIKFHSPVTLISASPFHLLSSLISLNTVLIEDFKHLGMFNRLILERVVRCLASVSSPFSVIESLPPMLSSSI